MSECPFFAICLPRIRFAVSILDSKLVGLLCKTSEYLCSCLGRKFPRLGHDLASSRVSVEISGHVLPRLRSPLSQFVILVLSWSLQLLNQCTFGPLLPATVLVCRCIPDFAICIHCHLPVPPFRIGSIDTPSGSPFELLGIVSPQHHFK